MEKLIRDNLHLISHPNYPNMLIRKVNNVIEHIWFLVKKITEEQLEFEKAQWNDKIKEASDLLEVYDTLINLYEITQNQSEKEKIIHSREQLLETIRTIWISIDEVMRIQKAKRIEKWGFRNGVIWIYD